MLRLLERTIDTIEDRLVLLAPQASVPAFFGQVELNSDRHNELMRELQKFRGRIYLQDGAVTQQQLSHDGLHKTAEDVTSWHLLMLNHRQQVTGCVWYLPHHNTVPVHRLRVRHCPLARMIQWRDKLWKAVESELARARRDFLHYAEVGGWAVAEESRCSSEALVLALAGYSLGRIGGGALGMTMATVRHCSSTILRRIGGSRLEVDGRPVPSYYDPKYGCEMEILRFDSRRPEARYSGLVERLRDRLANVLVIARPDTSMTLSALPVHLHPGLLGQHNRLPQLAY